MRELIYWDSCVFIDALQKTPDRYAACRYVIGRAAKQEVNIVTSVIALAEVIKFDDPTTDSATQSRIIRDFFENPYIILRAVDRVIAEDAHGLCSKYGLVHLDAIHVATALHSGVSVFHTYDGKKKRRKSLLRWNGVFGNPKLRIESPPDPPPLVAV